MRHWVLLVYSPQVSLPTPGVIFMYTGKKKEKPGLSLTNSKREYQYRPGLLNYEKTKPYAKRVKG